MKKPNLAKFVKTIKVALVKRSPEILTGIGITGMISTTVLAVRATPKAMRILDDHTGYNHDGVMEKPTKKEAVKLTWKCYIPTAVTGGLSVVCLVGASTVSTKRNTVLATAYTLSESVLRDYQEKVIEVIGEKKEQGIRDAIAKDKIDSNPVANQSIIITSKGETLCYDMISGRYFKCDIDRLKKIENELNHKILAEDYIALNDLYFEIGLPPISMGESLGWNVSDSAIGKCPIELYFSSQLTPDSTPCLVVNFRIEPRQDYYK